VKMVIETSRPIARVAKELAGTDPVTPGPGQVIILTEGPTEAQTLLGEEPNTSVIRLRSRLLELGVWSEGDVYDFDVALRTRNEVAHGKQKDLSRASVSQVDQCTVVARQCALTRTSAPVNRPHPVEQALAAGLRYYRELP